MKKNQVEKSTDLNSARDLGENFWNEHYKANTTGWDLGQVSPPLKDYIDQLKNRDLNFNPTRTSKSFQEISFLMKVNTT